MDMVSNDKKYKQVASAIGLSLIFMLIFTRFLLFNLPEIIKELLLPYGDTLSYTVSTIAHIFIYLASFMLPAFILRKLLKKKGLAEPMRLEFKMSASDLWLIPATIAICLSASVVNSLIMNLFVPSDVLSELLGATEPYEPYQVVLLFISSALVPAVCEEFLFRGAVASSLMPYGKTVAVVGSSVLFSLMHQNPYQIFYTLVAGLFLGYIYVKTGSIICSTILHFCNNAIAVLFDLCRSNVSGELGDICYYILMLAVYLFGAVSLVAYFAIEKKKKKNRFAEGSFGKVIDSCEDYAVTNVTHGKKLRYFFAPTMIIYFVLSISYTLLQAVALWLMGVAQ